MRRALSSGTCIRLAAAAAVGLLAFLAGPTGALAAAPGHAFTPPIAGIGSLLGGLAGTVLGGVSWTVNLAGSFILNLIGGLVKVLIPRSWIHQGFQILQWIVAVPDYTGKIAGPGGQRVYGFAGVNALRGLYTWLGVAILPLTALYATARAWSGQGDHVAMPLVRVVTVAIGVLSYTWLWGQAVALSNQITTAILSVGAVTAGIYKMFTLIVSGSVLVGLPLVGELLLAAAAAGLLGMIFLKVVLILIGALVYATGPLMIGLAPTERGHAIARAWASLTVALFTVGILWASVFAIAAVLLNDASSGALLLGGSTGIGRLLSGLVIAMAAIAGFYANIKLTKAIGGIVAGQLAGALSQIGGRGAGRLLGGTPGARSGGGVAAAGAGGASLRGFATRVGGGLAGAAAAVAPAGRAGAVLAAGAGAGGALARGGLVGAGGTLAARGVAGAARSNLGRAAGASRAGAVATRIARSGQQGWNAAANSHATGQAAGVIGGATAANTARRATATTPTTTPANGTPAAATANTPSPAPPTTGRTGTRPGTPGATSAPTRSAGRAVSAPPVPGAGPGAPTSSPTRPAGARAAPRVSKPPPTAGGKTPPAPPASPFAQRPAAGKPARSTWPWLRRKGRGS